MQAKKIASFLWFDANAEQAAAFYASVFGENCRLSGTPFELFGQRLHRVRWGAALQANAARAQKAMMGMQKLDLTALVSA